VNSALQHARRRIEERLPDRSQQHTLRALGDDRLRALVTRYCEALEEGDGEAMAAMLTDDAVWTMPPTPRRYAGHGEIMAFLAAEPFTISWRHVVARANGQPAVGWYRHDERRGGHVAEVLEVLTLRGAQIAAVTAFIGGEPFGRFGLPAELPDGQSRS
jgi:RNA polymerase sigma-70 factor (ECF subfamily)